MVTMTCPGMVTWMFPAHMHINLQLLFNAGIFPTNTLGEPGNQGAGVTGTQGMGVNTPKAAAVAAATAGLASDVHIPKGGMFRMGLLSMMLAMGKLVMRTRFTGNTTNGAGVMPNTHFNIAPAHTANAIEYLRLKIRNYKR